jgi:hypothetical protein
MKCGGKNGYSFPWYSKLAFNGLIELFVVLVSSPNLGNLSKNN